MKSIIRRILREQSDNGIIVYHGGKRFDRLRPGLFTTTDKEQVKWYVDRATNHGREEGVLVTLRIYCNNILTLDSKEDFENKWIPIIEDSGIDYEYNDTGFGWEFISNDINKHGGYIDDNPFDLIYVPNFIRSVIKNGYDCIQGEDYFGMSSMEIYIPLDVSKVEIIDVEEIKPNNINESEDWFERNMKIIRGEVEGWNEMSDEEKILYHTSCNDFNEFHRDKINYFSLTEKDSVRFHNNWRKCEDGRKGILYECNVKIGKVFDPNNLSEEEKHSIEELVNNTTNKSDLFMGDYGMKDYDFSPETTDTEFILHMLKGTDNWQVMEQPLFVNWMKENNYDSFIIEEYNFKDNSVGILNPNNIEIINKTQL